MRNLNNYEIGGRQLRVDHADTDQHTSTSARQQQQQQQYQRVPVPDFNTSTPPPIPSGPPAGIANPLPRGATLPTNVNPTDSISRTLSAFPPAELLQVISQLKAIATSSPDQARNLLVSSPQLAYAVVQAMLLMGIIDAPTLQSIMSNPTALKLAGVPQPPAPVQQVPLPQPQYQQGQMLNPPPPPPPHPSFFSKPQQAMPVPSPVGLLNNPDPVSQKNLKYIYIYIYMIK